jgi:HRDC domain
MQTSVPMVPMAKIGLTLDATTRDLFNYLASKRAVEAHKQKLPVNLVFSDTCLVKLATVRPTRLDLFRRVEGIAAMHNDELCTQWCRLIGRYCSSQKLPVNRLPGVSCTTNTGSTGVSSSSSSTASTDSSGAALGQKRALPVAFRGAALLSSRARPSATLPLRQRPAPAPAKASGAPPPARAVKRVFSRGCSYRRGGNTICSDSDSSDSE